MQTLTRDEKEPKTTTSYKDKNGQANQISLHSSLKQNYIEKEDKLTKSWSPYKNYETPQPDTKPKQVSLMSKIKNWATNLNYSFYNQSHSLSETLVITLLGEVFLVEQEDEMKKRISETLWFSYREKIPKILEETFGKGALTCDRGWGCMLRCGQMLMAEALKRHLNDAESLKKGLNAEAYLDIILLFADAIKNPEVSPFSIHQICSKAYEYFELKPGEWFKPSNIMVTLAKLNDQHHHYRLNNFRTCIFVDGTVFEDQIVQKVFNNTENQNPEEEKVEPHSKENANNEDPPVEESKINTGESEAKTNGVNQPALKLKEKWDNSLLIFIATKTGLDEHNELYLHTVLKLLSLKHSLGMLGGRGSKAYYFLGFQNSTLLYFDPHYVQDASPDIQSLEKDYYTYFLKKCFQINIKDIDTSVGFGFYIRNEIEYAEFKEALMIAMKDDPNFLVGFEETTPPVDIEHEDVIVCKEDESFEVIM